MTNLIKRFVDFATGEVTADVNNSSVNTEQVNNTDYWVPAGATASEINSIISDAPDGSVITFEQGDYHGLSASISDQGKNNITLQGPGDRGAHLKLASGVQQNVIELDGVEGWEIKGLYVDGNGANQSDDGSAETQCGIYTSGCRNIRIHHNIVEETFYANIRNQAINRTARDIIVAHNICDTTYSGTAQGEDNISFTAGGDGAGGALIEDWLVQGNTCRNCGHQAIEISTDANDGAVVDNNIYDPDSIAIYIHDGNTVRCADNNIRSGGAEGIVIGSSNSTANGNTVSDVTTVGIKLTAVDTVADGNTIKNAGGGGIVATKADVVVSDNRVTKPSATAIEMAGTDSLCEGNRVSDAGEQGILNRAVRNRITDNSVTGSTWWGIRTSAKRTKITDNNCYNNSRDGISVDSVDECVVNDNQLVNNGAYGIEIWDNSATPVDCEVNDNTHFGNTDGPIYDGGTRTRRNNTIELGTSPSGSNYDSGDSGVVILDTSTSPPTEHQVLQDGSVSTVQ